MDVELSSFLGPSGIQLNPGLDSKDPYGIPQGSALSSVLSNIYLLDFDLKVKEFLNTKNAIYRRYCDDILIVCSHSDVAEIDTFLKEKIREKGVHLKIHEIEKEFKHSKSQIYDFRNKEKIKNHPLQYLGFYFNGKSVLIRDSSLARYYRKAHKSIVATRLNVIKKLYHIKSSGKHLQEKQKNMYRKKLYKKYTVLGKNNFHTYVNRAFRQMEGVDNTKIKKQLLNHLKKIKKDIENQNVYINIAWDILQNSTTIPYKNYRLLIYSKYNQLKNN